VQPIRDVGLFKLDGASLGDSARAPQLEDAVGSVHDSQPAVAAAASAQESKKGPGFAVTLFVRQRNGGARATARAARTHSRG
jgi:hypothetical protein